MSKKQEALSRLAKRKAEAEKIEQINNADLYAGSPMHYYCRSCDLLAQTLPECHAERPRRYCDACEEDAQYLKGVKADG